MAELGYKLPHINTVRDILNKAHKSLDPVQVYDDEFKDKLLSLRDGPPPTGTLRWTLKSLADKMAELGYKRLHMNTVRNIINKAHKSLDPVQVYDDEFKTKLFALRDGPPPPGALRWTLKSLADKMAEMGYKRLHKNTVRSFLNKANISSSLGYDDEFKAKLFALRDGSPPPGALRWTRDSLADKMAELGYNRPHKTTVHNILKKANISPSVGYGDEFKAKLFALRDGPPPVGAHKWTLAMLADKMAELGYKRPGTTTISSILRKANISSSTAYDDEFKAKLFALFNGPPPAGALRWSLNSLADKMAEMGYKRPKKTTVYKMLKKAKISLSIPPLAYDDEYKAKLLSLRDGPPPPGALRWTLKSLADKMAELGYKRLSATTVRIILKKTIMSSSQAYDDEYKAKLLSLRDGPPPPGAFKWTLESLADKMAELGYKRPDNSTVQRILEKANLPTNS
jgi:precorrin-4 methylase